MSEHAEIINLIDLGKTAVKQRNETRSSPGNLEKLNDNLLASLEQSALFSDFNLSNGSCGMNNDELTALQRDQQCELNESISQNKNRRSILRNKFKQLSINNPVLSTRNNYEKLTDSLLVRTDSKYYGSFSKAAKTNETAFNNNVITTSVMDNSSLAGHSINSQTLLSISLKEFEKEKNLNLIGFKTILIVILCFCFLISLIYTFKVYHTLTDEHLTKFYEKNYAKSESNSERSIFDYYRATWIVNSIVTLIMLSLGIVGLLKEKVILILITSVYMMFLLLESDDPINGTQLFNISLMIILSTSVLLIVFAARLRCYAEDKLNLINKIQYAQY